MNLSRSQSLRRIPSISRTRWLVLLCGFALFLIVSFVLYIRSADSNHRDAEFKAMDIAEQYVDFKHIDYAVSHTWDETVWVVKGKDSADEQWMVIERKEGVVKLKLSENTTEKQIRQKFSDEHSGLKPIRALPGWFQGQPVWEIRYWSQIGGKHQAIDFYALKDGSRIRTYELPS
ncbi:hypothetical protein SD71_17430 [Cohnella kolymensis]|uniref:Cell wall elongation regulator TseB-like domain-containing protein n=1 Tax=Cohnella kolymensis TaxID=1590652 RepID=A0ABR5A174_9BACL|nr:DUF5590 domain-containing protein [Cohnella kolymensis]KIL34804.1 hypothetical protein SD71_17430 [Cohnella kolymensis]